MGTDVQTAVAERDAQIELRQRQWAQYVDRLKPQLARVLPKHIPEERLARIAITAARQSPKLTECTGLSLAGALLTTATLGLEPNTPTQESYLVAFRNGKTGDMEATLIVGYQGYVKLFWQHPLAADIYAEAVYPEDQFTWAKGTSPYIDHHPRPEARAKDSEPTHYYAVAWLINRSKPSFVVLTAAEVKVLRQGRVGPSGDIADPQRWMERKTAIRQLTKVLPKSALLAYAAQVDESSGTDLYRAAQATRAAEADPAEPEVPAILPGQGGDSVPVEDPPPGGEGL